jgi:hypothetical protein
MATLHLVGKVIGHELKKIVITDRATKRKSTFERMAVKMEFEDTETEKPSRAVFLMGVAQAKTEFEIGDAVNIDLDVRQQKMKFNGKKRGAAAQAH